ncbi:MAG: DUF2508 family protein [Monoglobaceae bacterium]
MESEKINKEEECKSRRKKQMNELMKEIEKARRDIEAAEANFEMAVNPADVDVYIYELRTVQARYGALLKRLKDIY